MNPLLVIGDSLLDRDLDGQVRRLTPDAPVPVVDAPVERCRAGGAALAATLAARDGRDVCFVTALADDDAGRTVAGLLRDAGVTLVDLGASDATGTKVRVRAAGHPLLRMDYGGADTRVTAPGDDVVALIRGARTILVSDYGRGVAAQAGVRRAVAAGAEQGSRVVWDPHPRGPAPTAGARLVTPNLAEAQRTTGVDDATLSAVAGMATTLRAAWDVTGVAVTTGAHGAVLVGADGTPLVVPTRRLRGSVDPCGAGDRFAASAAGAITDGAVLSEAVVTAVEAATAFVAGGGLATLWDGHGPTDDREVGSVEEVLAATRARGGTVVATGGCFDLLHAGHVQLLADARALGDCLVVYLNSDASVRRLKGEGRPLVAERDRRAVLLGLSAVDAVVVFDEDTPEQALSRMRPDVWVKGGDYAVADLPEADLVASWGGRAVILPYLAGRSTSAMIQEAVRHATQ